MGICSVRQNKDYVPLNFQYASSNVPYSNLTHMVSMFLFISMHFNFSQHHLNKTNETKNVAMLPSLLIFRCIWCNTCNRIYFLFLHFAMMQCHGKNQNGLKNYQYVMLWTIWYHLHNLKNIKNTHGGVLIFDQK